MIDQLERPGVNGDRSLAPLAITPESLMRQLRARPVLWVGAGASAAAGVPTSAQLAAALIAEADDAIAADLPFPNIAQAFVASRGAGALEELLQRLIGPPRPLTPLHRAIARVAATGCFAFIVTTNYDGLLERALDEAGVPYIPQHMERNATVAGHGEVRLLKLHGSREDWASVVLSQDSYESFEERYKFLWRELDLLLRRHPVLFVGCSLQDPRILDWLARLTAEQASQLKAWRAVMTDSEWQKALAAPWQGDCAATVLARSTLRPLLLRDHAHLQEVWSHTAAEWAAELGHIERVLETTKAPYQAPHLPPHFIPRAAASERLKALLFAQGGSADQTLWVIAIHGLGGIGKSTLAASLAAAPDVQARFPGGILWATLGQQPDLLPLLGGWVQALGDYSFRSTSVRATSTHLRALLRNSAALLVVDDAWDYEHVEPFLIGGPRCRVLITTRESLSARFAGAVEFDLDAMTMEQALALVASWLGRDLAAAERDAARALAEAVGFLPLALELAAAQIREGVEWSELLDDLAAEIARLEALEPPGAYQVCSEEVRKRFSVVASFRLSLLRLRADRLRAFAWLGVLPEEVLLNPKMAATVWDVTVGEAHQTLHDLRNRSLLSASGEQDFPRTYRLHDLLHDQARRLLTAPETAEQGDRLPGLGLTWPSAHAALLGRYQKRLCDGGWATLPDDGYIHRHLTWHLEQAQMARELHTLLAAETCDGKNAWYEACDARGEMAGFAADVTRGWRLAAASSADAICSAAPLAGIGLEVRYALIIASLNSLSSNIPADLMVALVASGDWTSSNAFAHARHVTDPRRRAAVLTALAANAPEALLAAILKDALAAARRIPSEKERAAALCELAPHLSGGTREQILEEALVTALAAPGRRAALLGSLAVHLSEASLQRALAAIRDLPWSPARLQPLAALAPYLPTALRRPALAVAEGIESPAQRCRALLCLRAHFPEPLAEEALRVALEAAKSIGSEEARGRELAAIAGKLGPGDAHRPLWGEILTVTRDMGDGLTQRRLIEALVPRLPAPLRGDALAVARAIASSWRRGEALASLAPHFSAEERSVMFQEALSAARRVTQKPSRTKALSALALRLADLGDPVRAVAAAREIATLRGRTAAFIALLPHLPQRERDSQMAHLLADVRQDEIPWRRARELTALAAYLQRPWRDKVLAEASAAAQKVRTKQRRNKVLAAVAAASREEPPLSAPPRRPSLESSLAERLATARWIGDGDAVVRALLALTPHLASSSREKLLPDIVAAARSIRDPLWRAQALRELAAGQPDLLGEALRATLSIASAGLCFRELAALAPRVPEPLLVQAVEPLLSQKWPKEASDDLIALAPALPTRLLRVALTTAATMPKSSRARVIEHLAGRLAARLAREGRPRQAVKSLRNLGRRARTEALGTLLLDLPEPLRAQVLEEIEESVRREGIGYRALAAIAPFLPALRLEELLATARQGWGGNYLVYGLAALLPHLEEPARSRVVRDALDAAREIAPRVEELAALAPHVPEADRIAALEAELSIQKVFGEKPYLDTLLLFAPWLPFERQRQALQAARSIPYPTQRAQALAELVPHVPEPLQREALAAVRRIRDPVDRSAALAAFPPNLRDASEPLANLYPAWAEKLRRLAVSTRSDLLSVLVELGHQLPDLGGDEATTEVCRALLAVSRAWP